MLNDLRKKKGVKKMQTNFNCVCAEEDLSSKMSIVTRLGRKAQYELIENT